MPCCSKRSNWATSAAEDWKPSWSRMDWVVVQPDIEGLRIGAPTLPGSVTDPRLVGGVISFLVRRGRGSRFTIAADSGDRTATGAARTALSYRRMARFRGAVPQAALRPGRLEPRRMQRGTGARQSGRQPESRKVLPDSEDDRAMRPVDRHRAPADRHAHGSRALDRELLRDRSRIRLRRIEGRSVPTRAIRMKCWRIFIRFARPTTPSSAAHGEWRTTERASAACITT